MPELTTAPTDSRGAWRSFRSVLWRRLDEPSMELCLLSGSEDGFLLHGHVVSAIGNVPRRVEYQVLCGPDWVTRFVHVSLHVCDDVSELQLTRTADGHWLRDGTELSDTRGLLDVDLSFTPATNSLAVRRRALAVGEAADVTAVWVGFPELSIELLSQRYTRVGELAYRYESDSGRFRADIDVDELGLVTMYQGLFERVAATDAPVVG